MIINNNMNAMNAHRNMSFNTTQTGKAMEKLSSGLRINRAGDDAAGLAISEKMRGQIRGLDQATRNSQDGISLIQTAEGALNETHSILQRMRELSVQASNDTNTDTDRSEIQKEVNQLKNEINRVSNDTEFNTKTLLNGDLGFEVNASAGATNISDVKINNLDLKAGTYNIETTAITRSTTNVVGPAGASATIAATNDAALGENTVKFEAATNGTSDYDAVLYDKAGNELARLADQSAGTSVTVGGVTVGATGNFAVGQEVKFETQVSATFEVKDNNGNTVGEAKTIEDDKTGKVNVGGFEVSFKANLAAAVDATVTVNDSKTLSFQIGANQDQSIRLGINNMSASGLGVEELDLTSAESANKAITTINTAIETVSAERSKLGAAQNRLEHTINNLSTSAENLQAAESRIRDVDMAKEMMNFTKNNILNQAAQAMMAQSKSQPEAVLQLLR